ncbi:MAG: hypothetical protein AB7V39_00435 [Nitrospiraceae bacterium]
MPHIPKSEYEPVRNGGMLPTPGRLNWLVSDTIIDYVNLRGLSYQTIHEVRVAIQELKMGSMFTELASKIASALRSAYPGHRMDVAEQEALFGNVWDEFYRVVAGPYENEAMNKNGNAYERLWNVEYQKREANKQKLGSPGFRMEAL